MRIPNVRDLDGWDALLMCGGLILTFSVTTALGYPPLQNGWAMRLGIALGLFGPYAARRAIGGSPAARPETTSHHTVATLLLMGVGGFACVLGALGAALLAAFLADTHEAGAAPYALLPAGVLVAGGLLCRLGWKLSRAPAPVTAGVTAEPRIG
jgi:hypothetical protein